MSIDRTAERSRSDITLARARELLRQAKEALEAGDYEKVHAREDELVYGVVRALGKTRSLGKAERELLDLALEAAELAETHESWCA